MVNRSQIFRAAWADYRLARPAFFALGDGAGKRVFLPSLFAKALRGAWADTKAAEVQARRTAEANAAAEAFMATQHRGRVDLAARMTAGQRSVRISSVRDEITLLDYAPWGVRVSDRRASLLAELAALLEADAALTPALAA